MRRLIAGVRVLAAELESAGDGSLFCGGHADGCECFPADPPPDRVQAAPPAV